MTIKETIEEAKKVGVKDMSWKAWFMIVTIISAAVVASYYGVNVTMNVDLNTRLSIVEGLLTQPINSTFYTLQKESNYIVSVVKSGATTYYTLQNGTDGTLQWYSTNKTALHVAAAGNLTDGGTIFCKNQTWTNTLTLLNTVMVIESYNGTWRTYSNQGKIMVPQLAADPSTSGWDQTQQGFEWYNTVEDTRKYWNGTTIVTFPSIGGGSVANGTYTLAQKFLVYKVGSTYYAENSNGGVPYSDTNATTVINLALGALSANRLGKQKVTLMGDIVIDGTLWITVHTELEVLGSITQTANRTMLQSVNVPAGLSGTSQDLAEVYIHGGQWYANASTADCIVINANDTCEWQLENLKFFDTCAYALNLSHGRFIVSDIVVDKYYTHAVAGMYLLSCWDSFFSNYNFQGWGACMTIVGGGPNIFVNIEEGGGSGITLAGGAHQMSFQNIIATDAWAGAFIIDNTCSLISLMGGIMRSDSNTNGSYSYIYNGGDNCTVSGFVFCSVASHYGKYCIEETTGADCNVYVANVFGAWVTGAYLKLGSNSKFESNVGAADG